MLTLIESGFGRLGKEEMLKLAEQTVKNKKKGFLIVPEQQTVGAEKEISLRLGAESALYFEVTNFTRFANTAFRAMGGICGEYCSKAKKALMMWITLTELSPTLTMTRGRPDVMPGTVTRAMAAVNEMQALGISPDELASLPALQEGEDGRLKAKLGDLSLIYSLYKKLLSERYNDTQDDVMMLAKMLANDPSFLSGSIVLIDGFTSFTEPQYRLIEQMMRTCEVAITLTIPKAGRDGFEYMELRSTHQRLSSIADRSGVQKKLIRPDGKDQRRDPLICDLSAMLWRNDGVFDNNYLQILKNNRERVRIFAARSPFDECEFIASDIRRRVMDGDRYSDFAVIARSTDSYSGILNTAFDRAGIPHFFSRNTDITAFEAVKLIFTAYMVAIRGFKAEDVITYTKCGLCGVSRKDCDEFESYVEKWRIDGKRFIDGIEFNMNPRGYEVMNDKDAAKLARIEKTRAAVTKPLIAFAEDLKEAKTVTAHAGTLLRFLVSIKLEIGLKERALELEAMGEVALAEENSKLWKMICDCLDTVVECLGDMPCDSQSFLNQLSVVLKEAGVGRIPTHKDEVTVGAADMLRIDEKKHVYLIGVNSGHFPASVSDDSYFSAKDKAKLQLMGLPIEPDLEVKGARELYCFSRALSFSSYSVTLSYNEKSPDLTSLLPSEVIGTIGRITAGIVKPVRISSLPPEDRIWSAEDALELLGELEDEKYEAIAQALTERGYGRILKIADGDVENKSLRLSEETAALLYKDAIYLSETRISCFMNCPLEYFCKHTLKLDGGETAALGSNVVGTFIHSILENFFSELKVRGKNISTITKEEKEELTERCASSYVKELFGSTGINARGKVAIKRLKRAALPVIDGLCDEFKSCEFTPTFFELSIGADPLRDPNPLEFSTRDGGKVIIRGQVDRVDTYRHGDDVYVRVIDYKTGAKEFSPTDLAEGRNLQMFLYLKSIVETDSEGFRERIGVPDGGRLIPAGVIYVKTKVDDTTVSTRDDKAAEETVKQMQKREGMLLSDEVSINAMNPDYLPPEPSARSRNPISRRYTEDEWKEINSTIESVVSDIGSRIREGDIRATGFAENERHCGYCPYKKLCRSAKK